MSKAAESHRCHLCGGAIKYSRKSYRYTSAGLKNVVLAAIRVGECVDCREEYPEIPGMAELHEVLAHAVTEKPTELIGDELRFLRKAFGLSVKDLAQEFGLHPMTIYKWETGEETITRPIDRLYRLYFIRKGMEKFDWRLEEKKPDFSRIARKPARPPLCVNLARESFAYNSASCA